MIHDGARPLISDELITAMSTLPENYECAVCGVPLKDTLKETGAFTKTPDRSKFVAVQTPQTLNYKIYKELLENCNDKTSFTDDCSVLEAAGYNTAVIDGEETNIKITTAIDLVVAEAFIKEIEQCE
jgi:2-C-methyl-D-erythritol 4-phosphate cytidylyltransferase